MKNKKIRKVSGGAQFHGNVTASESANIIDNSTTNNKDMRSETNIDHEKTFGLKIKVAAS